MLRIKRRIGWMGVVFLGISALILVGKTAAGRAAESTVESTAESTVESVSAPSTEQVSVSEEPLILPTYQIAPPDANAFFFTGRTYQGARGEIYPYPFYDTLTDTKVDQTYRALRLQNAYLDIIVLPEIGGRILQGRDKTNGYDFFYRQTGIKPALIGMLGAWLSGGVEWNIPHHHRASSFMEIGSAIRENADGSRTIHVGETEFRQRMKWSAALTLEPDHSYLEAKIRIANRSDLIESMLYWANVSVHCDENYRVIFPPQTLFGTGHSKTEFTRWPVDDTGVDLALWKNHPNPRSIFAWNFTDDFLAGYDAGKDAGTVHVANHHQVGGKKFFLWGTGGEGQMWDKMLSDADGPYLELMVGAYSDNQPDYSWIFPGTVREFTQYWYPIRGMKNVKAATRDAALDFEPLENGKIRLAVCATGTFRDARIRVRRESVTLFEKTVTLDPASFFAEELTLDGGIDGCTVTVCDAAGRTLAAYTPKKPQADAPFPEPVAPTAAAADIATNEELYLAGLRIEQFHNARLDAMTYYNEALRRDPSDARVNTAVGLRRLREGKFDTAAAHFRRAVERYTKGYTVSRTGEPHYYLGLIARYQNRLDEAADQFWKATWTTDYERPAFFELARLACRTGDFETALGLIRRSLYGTEETAASDVASHDAKGLVAEAFILRQLGGDSAQQAAAILDRVEAFAPLDEMAALERAFLSGEGAAALDRLDDHWGCGFIKRQTLLEVAADYAALGGYHDAAALLDEALRLGGDYASVLVAFWDGWMKERAGNGSPEALIAAKELFHRAESLDLTYNFPFRLEELALFETVLTLAPENRAVRPLYGDLLYYFERQDEAIDVWTQGTKRAPENGLLWRNLGFALARQGDRDQALAAYESAQKAAPGDPKILAEYDALCEKARQPLDVRLDRLSAHLETVMKHDDAVVRLLALYNKTGQEAESLKILAHRHFHVWEGGRSPHVYFVEAHELAGARLFQTGQFIEAAHEFEAADAYPENLEKGRPQGGGMIPELFWLAGRAYQKAGDTDAARQAFEKAAAAQNGQQAQSDDTLKFFRALALRKIGASSDAEKQLAELTTQTDSALAASDSAKIDEFSKFGEDGGQAARLARLHYVRGLLWLEKGRRDDARRSFEESARLDPSRPGIFDWPEGLIEPEPTEN